MELIDGERYDQLFLEGETPEAERIRVGMGGGGDGRVVLFIVSESLGETHYLVRAGVEPHDALTTVTSGGQSTDTLKRWMLKRSEARAALAHHLDASALDERQEWERFDAVRMLRYSCRGPPPSIGGVRHPCNRR